MENNACITNLYFIAIFCKQCLKTGKRYDLANNFPISLKGNKSFVSLFVFIIIYFL